MATSQCSWSVPAPHYKDFLFPIKMKLLHSKVGNCPRGKLSSHKSVLAVIIFRQDPTSTHCLGQDPRTAVPVLASSFVI